MLYCLASAGISLYNEAAIGDACFIRLLLSRNPLNAVSVFTRAPVRDVVFRIIL